MQDNIQEVSKDMIINDILQLHPEVAAILFKSGMHCVGCPSSRGETLEEAGMIHGLDVDKIIEEIKALA